jgi:hypothetical protein
MRSESGGALIGSEATSDDVGMGELVDRSTNANVTAKNKQSD